MNLVDEKHIALLQIGQQGGQIAGLFNGGAGGNADLHAHLLRHNTGQRGLAQTRRAVEQDVIHRLAALLRRPQIDPQIALGLLLTDIVLKRFRAEGDLLGVNGQGVGAYEPTGINGEFLIQFLLPFPIRCATDCAVQW